MTKLQQFAYMHPLASAYAPMLEGYFRSLSDVGLRFGLTLNR